MKATLTKTKAGNGLKLAIDGKWLYTSKKNFAKFLADEKSSITFSEMDSEADKE